MKWLAVLSLILLPTWSTAAEVCWRDQPAAGYYVLTFAAGTDEKNITMAIGLEEYTTDSENVNHWAIPDGLKDELDNGTFTLTMHTIYMNKSRPWMGRPLRITEFDCTEPVTLLPPDVFGDATCDNKITATDALAILRWSTGAEAAPLGCP